MRRDSKFLVPAAVIALITLPSLSRAGNLLINGSFELPSFVGTYVHLNGSDLPGWTLFSEYKGTVQFTANYDRIKDGNQAVQIEVPGDWISQSFETRVGSNYRLSFELAAYSVYGGPGLGYTPCPCTTILNVSVASANAILSSTSDGYGTKILDFTAISPTTTLTLMNPAVPAGWGNYPQVDNVSVVLISSIPDAATFVKLPLCLSAIGLAVRRHRT
jgi:hypothetical protein